jgi:oxygen-independent coproporphyrinogen III oxidase
LGYLFHNLEHLYIHWPFCPYKCHFCDFVALASHEQFMERYHQALVKEIRAFKGSFTQTKPLKTIYFGGGTPSTYPPELLLDTFDTLKDIFLFDENTEVTFEVNPGTVTKEALKVWKKVGINRLSIGVQSLKDQVLQGLNRHQKATDVYALLDDVKKDFDNVSVDFILGLPGVSVAEWKQMVHDAMKWPIQHISVYFLMVQENTPLYFKVKTNKVQLPPDDEIVDLYEWLVELLESHGFYRYELSNFAKSGFESCHNQAYWDRKPYAAFGLGACSFNGSARCQNEKNLGKYMDLVQEGKSVICEREELDDQKIAEEKIMLGLRQRKGVCIKDIMGHFSEEKQKIFLSNVERLQSQKLIEQKNGFIFLTPRGYALENEVAVRLFL